MYRNGKFFAIHSDHLGTPRLMTDDTNKPIWQWPYSAFGSNKPTGVLKATPNPRAALTNQPVLLKATAAKELNLRFPGQYSDDETGQFYNYFRSFDPRTGRYPQPDPIGTSGGWNRFIYAENSPLMFTDALGLQSAPGSAPHRPIVPNLNPNNKMPILQPKTQCVLACQAKMYPACAATAYGVGMSFSAIATPAVGLGAAIVTSGTCNAVVMNSYCTQECEKKMLPKTCTPSLPPIDPNAQYAQ
jgi:RHS repeat-associated protein